MNLAPIVLFVYNRPLHTRRTIIALKNNSLAKESDLFIFSDAPKTLDQEKKVKEVRNLIRGIKGFKNVFIEEKSRNSGLANSVIGGVSKVVSKYKKVIVLEDDMLTSPNFLTFMNNALSFYRENKSVFSISGYRFPIKIPANYTQDVFIAKRPSSWGWATWKDRWEKADWEVNDFKELSKNKKLQRAFNEGGEDLFEMLSDQMNGYVNSWAIRWAYTHFKNNGYCLYPVRSKVLNIGTDLSGTHLGRTKKFDIKLDTESSTECLIQNIAPDKLIEKEMKVFFRKSFLKKITGFLRKKIYYRILK